LALTSCLAPGPIFVFFKPTPFSMSSMVAVTVSSRSPCCKSCVHTIALDRLPRAVDSARKRKRSRERRRGPGRFLASAPGRPWQIPSRSLARGGRWYSRWTSGTSFPLGLERGVAALRRRRTRRLHYSMSSWQ
jgi:hypothetical protein